MREWERSWDELFASLQHSHSSNKPLSWRRDHPRNTGWQNRMAVHLPYQHRKGQCRLLDPTHLPYCVACGAGGGHPHSCCSFAPAGGFQTPRMAATGHGGSLRRNLLADLEFSSPALAWEGSKAGSSPGCIVLLTAISVRPACSHGRLENENEPALPNAKDVRSLCLCTPHLEGPAAVVKTERMGPSAHLVGSLRHSFHCQLPVYLSRVFSFASPPDSRDCAVRPGVPQGKCRRIPTFLGLLTTSWTWKSITLTRPVPVQAPDHLPGTPFCTPGQVQPPQMLPEPPIRLPSCQATGQGPRVQQGPPPGAGEKDTHPEGGTPRGCLAS